MAGKDSSTAIIVIVIMMVTILAIGSGWYILNGDDDKKDKKKGSECPGPDVNAVYQYDDDGNCVRVSCKTGYWDEGGFCIERRDLSEELYEGTDCVIDGYTFQGCELKVDGICGEVGGGEQLRVPNITADVIGSGTCETADYVDCVVPCPETCKVADDKYTAPEGAVCMASGYELGQDSGFCGTGTQVRTLDTTNIDLEGTGFDTVEEYLDYANPNDICEAQKPVVSGSCYVDCAEGLTDVGCGSIQEQEYIKDEFGNAVCFDKEEAEKYIRGELLQKPKRLPVILASAARNVDGTYDVEGKVPESDREGLRILYRSDQGISFESMVKNDCTLYSTEACQAPRESVNCVIGVTNRSECQATGCGRQGSKTLSYGITTYPFGSTTGVPNACPSYESTGYETHGCPLAASCCDETYVGPWTEVEGYDGCVEDVDGQYRRQSTRQGNGDLCSNSNTKLGASCNYDCKLESIGMEYKGTTISSSGMGCTGRYNKKDLTSISLRAAKGGTACPEISTLLNVPFQSSDQVNAILEGADFSAVSVPDFKCGSWLRGGQCGVSNMNYDTGTCVNGNNCGEGDNFSGQVGWYRKPSFQMNC